MQPTNFQLVTSQEALNALLGAPLKGVYALRVRDIAEAAETRARRVQEVRSQLQERVEDGELSEEEADEELQEVLEDDFTINAEPIPEEALEDVEISARHLIDLEWMIE